MPTPANVHVLSHPEALPCAAPAKPNLLPLVVTLPSPHRCGVIVAPSCGDHVQALPTPPVAPWCTPSPYGHGIKHRRGPAHHHRVYMLPPILTLNSCEQHHQSCHPFSITSSKSMAQCPSNVPRASEFLSLFSLMSEQSMATSWSQAAASLLLLACCCCNKIAILVVINLFDEMPQPRRCHVVPFLLSLTFLVLAKSCVDASASQNKHACLAP